MHYGEENEQTDVDPRVEIRQGTVNHLPVCKKKHRVGNCEDQDRSHLW